MSSGAGASSFGYSGGASSFGYSGGASYSPMSFGPTHFAGLHHKKDGTLDMRYSSSRVAAPSAQFNHTSRPPSSSGLHYKKDGTLDMRYSSSRVAAPSAQFNHTSRPPSSSGLHYKKDGTLDMRFSSSKNAASSTQSTHVSRPPSSSGLHYKKDGTLDMRYASSKNAMTSYRSGSTFSDHGIPKNIPVTKAGMPDMRTTAAKEWVKEQAQSGMEDIPSWIPRTKDGSLDTSKAITQEYLKWNNTPSANYDPNQRLAYYFQKLEDMLFRRLVEDAREDDVEMPQYEMLPETPEIQRQLSSRPMRSSIRQDDDEIPQYEMSPERPESQRQFSSRMMRSSIRQDDEYDIRSQISESVPVIDYKDLNINPDDKLGQGSFGIVYKGIWNHRTVAVKQLHLNKLTRQEKNSFVKEIRIMSKLGKHPNLVYLYGYTSEPPCLVMEYVELGSLSYLLHYCEDSKIEAKITDGRIKKKLILGIVLGMNQLHATNIVHGDLKPQNVLVAKDYTAKVTDFGFATLRGKTSSSIASSVTSDDGSAVCGTAGYMAPELLNNSNPPEYSSDVYSFGVMLNEVIQEEEPYSDQFRNFLGRGPFAAVNYARLGNRPSIHSRTPIFLKNFIKKCWNHDPRSRPSFQQIFNDLRPSHVKFPNSFEL
jgi:predicted Ser/Thr protein kinase